MARDFLLVDGVDIETKQALKEAALARFGKANASLLVRALISDYLQKGLFTVDADEGVEVDLSSDNVRISLSIPESCLNEIDRRADNRLSPRNYYLCNLIFEHLGKPQLMVDEVEALKKSNYQMTKLGINLNNIAKAYSSMSKNGYVELMPELVKSLNKLKLDIYKHTNMVLKILESGTFIMETKGRGRGQVKTEK
jgi:hypothetical protein